LFNLVVLHSENFGIPFRLGRPASSIISSSCGIYWSCSAK